MANKKTLFSSVLTNFKLSIAYLVLYLARHLLYFELKTGIVKKLNLAKTAPRLREIVFEYLFD